MGTEVLRPQDCLIDRVRFAPAVFQHHRRRNFQANRSGNGNGTPNPRVSSRKPVVRPEQKKNVGRSEPLMPRRSSSLDDLRKGQNHNLMMGQVMILRRGESLDSKINGDKRHHQPVINAGDDLVVCGTERLGPDPDTVPKQIRIGFSPVSGAGYRPDMYAGSAFSMSPSPSSLPLPSFFSKKQVSKLAADDSATRDLRRLLRLD